jgi:hypothetical protein
MIFESRREKVEWFIWMGVIVSLSLLQYMLRVNIGIFDWIVVVLTYAAWTRGWRWRSLIPAASLFIVGLVIGLTGNTTTTAVKAWMNIVTSIALGIMVGFKPNRRVSE